MRKKEEADNKKNMEKNLSLQCFVGGREDVMSVDESIDTSDDRGGKTKDRSGRGVDGEVP